MMTIERVNAEIYAQQQARDYADAEADQRMWQALSTQRNLEASCTVSYSDDGAAIYTVR